MTLAIAVSDENDNAPFFPVTRQIHSVKENASPGSPVFIASARDLDNTGSVKYAITGQEFRIGETNGRVVTQRKFDYVTEREFSFLLTATDPSGRTASAEVIVKIGSQDEFPPVFEQPSYKYNVDQELAVGYILGRIHATDADEGPDGRVVYSMTTGGEYLRVKPETGGGAAQTLGHRHPQRGQQQRQGLPRSHLCGPGQHWESRQPEIFFSDHSRREDRHPPPGSCSTVSVRSGRLGPGPHHLAHPHPAHPRRRRLPLPQVLRQQVLAEAPDRRDWHWWRIWVRGPLARHRHDGQQRGDVSIP